MRRSDFPSCLPLRSARALLGGTAASLRRRSDLSGSWQTFALVPCSATPVDPRRLAISTFRCCLPQIIRCRHPLLAFRGSIARPLRSLSTLRSTPLDAPRKTRYQLGGQPLLDGTSTRRVRHEVSALASYTASPSPRLG